ncbi:MAG: hypothetical protein L3J32_12885 [Rhizobiaceae bacterium]|nr:hypothetical protein [Rhizobiaceae bacterium]
MAALRQVTTASRRKPLAIETVMNRTPVSRNSNGLIKNIGTDIARPRRVPHTNSFSTGVLLGNKKLMANSVAAEACHLMAETVA